MSAAPLDYWAIEIGEELVRWIKVKLQKAKTSRRKT
jgi:hypothetical protein